MVNTGEKGRRKTSGKIVSAEREDLEGHNLDFGYHAKSHGTLPEAFEQRNGMS